MTLNSPPSYEGGVLFWIAIDEGRTLYECICEDCGLEDVLTPQEMIEHEKIGHGENK